MTGWISVKDKLPECDLWVLWLDGRKTMGHHPPFHHVDKINRRKETFINYLHNYTHWMPLPEPPNN